MKKMQLGRRVATYLAGGVLFAFAMPLTIQAGEMALKSDIESAVSDKTYQGSMLNDAFAEYYSPDGKISGKGYSGKWRAADGTMCFQYGDKPENCWAVKLEGPAMTMYKDGQVDGNGILVKGNPQDF